MQFKFHWAAIALLSVFIQGCPSSGVSTTPLGGVAAVGAPLAGATVILVDAAGTTKNVTADAEGAYTFDDVGAMTAPFLLKASGVVGGEEQTIYSALDEKPTPGETAVLNATPMTNAVVAQLSDGDPAKLFAAPTTMGTFIKPADMGAAKQKIIAVLEDQMKEQGLDPTKFDPFKTPFKANSSGFDKMLDLVKMQADASGNMTVIDKSTGIEKSIAKTETLAAMTAKKMPPPPAGMKDLDFSKVKLLIDNTNTALKSGDTSALNKNFDEKFVMDGLEESDFIKKIIEKDEIEKFGSFVFGSCNVKDKICDGTITLIKKDTSFNQYTLPVKFVDDEGKQSLKWFGNQRAFKFVLTQEVVISATVDSLNKPKIESQEGFRLWIDKTTGSKAILSVGIKPSLNTEPTSWTDIATLDKNQSSNQPFECKNLRLVKVDQDPCNHFINFKDIGEKFTDIKAEEAYKAGLLQFKITLLGDNDSLISEPKFRPNFKIFDSTESEKIKSSLEKAFKLNELGGSQVTMPKGLSINFVGIQTNSTFVGFDARMPDLSKLGDVLTMEEICAAAIKMQTPSASDCTSSSKISALDWSFKDPGGSGVVIVFKYALEEKI